MNGIPVTVNITVNDVLLLSEFLEKGESKELGEFAFKVLDSVSRASEQLSRCINQVEGANPCHTEKIEM